jgi:hypothetical protein
MKEETILFKLPKAEYRTGKVVDEVVVDGVEMPVVEDHIGIEYPVHPQNVEDDDNQKWSANV